MLEQYGYDVHTEQTEEGLVITDTENAELKGRKVLYIGKESRTDKNYLRRPFEKQALKQAVELLIGETASEKVIPNVLKIDKKRKTVTYGEEKLEFTEKELALLLLLYESKGKAVSDKEIIEKVWKNETAQGSNIVAVYVNYLRAKLDEKIGKRLIFRVRGQGYMLKERD